MRTEELLALGMFGQGSRLGERVAALLDPRRRGSSRVSKPRLAASGALLTACLAAAAISPRVLALAQQPRFEVTSVRANGQTRGRFSNRFTGGRFTASNVTADTLVTYAYTLHEFQVSGEPGWMKSDRFDLDATAKGEPDLQQKRLLVQGLLADRFGLAVHHETKELPVYELVVAKRGSKLRDAKCIGQEGPQNPCGGFSVSTRGALIGRAAPVSSFADAISPLLSRLVIDKTGLNGLYDFDLKWTPDESMPHGPGDAGDPPVDANGPSIYTAVQEQLGLELRAAKGPVDILVIDHAEKPAAN